MHPVQCQGVGGVGYLDWMTGDVKRYPQPRATALHSFAVAGGTGVGSSTTSRQRDWQWQEAYAFAFFFSFGFYSTHLTSPCASPHCLCSAFLSLFFFFVSRSASRIGLLRLFENKYSTEVLLLRTNSTF
jgi:hypothetical protein